MRSVPLRSIWYWSKAKRGTLKRLQLFDDVLEEMQIGLGGWHTHRIALGDVERVDLVPRHKSRDMLLLLRFKDGSKQVLGVPQTPMWQQAIRTCLEG